MKNLLTSILLAFVLLGVPAISFTGCATSQSTKQIAYKSLKSVQQASVAALKIYGAAYQRGEITPETREKVLTLYVKYQAAFELASTAAQFNYESPSTAELTAAVSELIQLIQTLRK